MRGAGPVGFKTKRDVVVVLNRRQYRKRGVGDFGANAVAGNNDDAVVTRHTALSRPRAQHGAGQIGLRYVLIVLANNLAVADHGVNAHRVGDQAIGTAG